MPVYEITECDNCENTIIKKEKNTHYLIYSINFWNNKTFNPTEKDFLFDRDCAAILCSKECIGEYLSKIINGDNIE